MISDCLSFGLESESFRKCKTLLSESFGGNCARALRLTAMWATSYLRELTELAVTILSN